MRVATVAIIILVLGLLLYWCVFTVDFNEIVIVKTFGGAAKPIEGKAEKGAGLHFKWPWPVQEIVRYDARTFVFEDPYKETQTRDRQQVLMSLFCVWRIKDAAKFHTTIKTVSAAQSRLRVLLQSENKNVVGAYPLNEFLAVADTSKDPGAVGGLQRMEKAIFDSVSKTALANYGVEIQAVGIKSFGLSEDVSKTVIKNMQEERMRFAEEFRSRGRAYAALIESRADTAAKIIGSFADHRSQSIRNQGERDAANVYVLYKGHESFAIFLRELEFLKETLKENTVFIGSSELDRSFGYFREPPTGDTVRARAGAVAGSGDSDGDGR